MIESEIKREYFDWMCRLVCGRRFAKENSYDKLFRYLHAVEFIWFVKKDRNRAEDGIDLRYRFFVDNSLDDASDLITGPCSVLEMMIALSMRCEESIMDDPSVGDRTGQWFWKMIVNLGLGSMNDRVFDANLVDDSVAKFLYREYEPDGRGGLFRIKNCEYDLRKVEIWYQLCYYLDTIM